MGLLYWKIVLELLTLWVKYLEADRSIEAWESSRYVGESNVLL